MEGVDRIFGLRPECLFRVQTFQYRFIRHCDWCNASVRIVVKLREAYTALVGAGSGDMVEEPPFAFELHDGTVHVAGAVFEDDALVFEGAERSPGDAVLHEVGDQVAAVGRIAEVIQALELMYPDALVIIFHVEHLDRPVAGDHIFLKLDDGQVVAAVAEVEVGLAVVVDEDVGIEDAYPRDFVATDERFTERVFEMAGGRAGYGNADLAVGGEVKVVFAIAFDTVGRPGILLCPGNVLEREDYAVVFPVDHVGGGEDMPVHHVPVLAACDVVGGIDVDTSVEDAGRRVGLEIGKDLMLRTRGET